MFAFKFPDLSSHTQGPLDASLYATILKKPSPTNRCVREIKVNTITNADKRGSTGPPNPSYPVTKVNIVTTTTRLGAPVVHQDSKIEIRTPIRTSSRNYTTRHPHLCRLNSNQSSPRPCSSLDSSSEHFSHQSTDRLRSTSDHNTVIYSTISNEKSPRAIKNYQYRTEGDVTDHHRQDTINDRYRVRSSLTSLDDASISTSGTIKSKHTFIQYMFI